MQRLDAPDPDHIRARASDMSSHTVEHIGKINHMRFLGRILNDRAAFRQNGCQHYINGSADGNNVKINMAAHQFVRFRLDLSVFKVHRRAKGFKSLDVLVNRSRPDDAAARHRHFRFMKAS